MHLHLGGELVAWCGPNRWPNHTIWYGWVWGPVGMIYASSSWGVGGLVWAQPYRKTCGEKLYIFIWVGSWWLVLGLVWAGCEAQCEVVWSTRPTQSVRSHFSLSAGPLAAPLSTCTRWSWAMATCEELLAEEARLVRVKEKLVQRQAEALARDPYYPYYLSEIRREKFRKERRRVQKDLNRILG